MTELILGSRCSGKTTELIKRSAKDGIYILTGTKTQARYLFEQATSMGYNIPYPVTLEDYRRNHFRGSSIRFDGVLIDQADWVLQHLLGNVPIRGVTWTKSELFTDLDTKEKQND